MTTRKYARIGLTEISLNPSSNINEQIVQVRIMKEKPAYELPDLGEIVGITGMQEVDEQIYAVH